MTLLAEVKALAKKLRTTVGDKPVPEEYFDGLSETTLGYLLISMQHIERERQGEE
jgi:hypothetical protein